MDGFRRRSNPGFPIRGGFHIPDRATRSLHNLKKCLICSVAVGKDYYIVSRQIRLASTNIKRCPTYKRNYYHIKYLPSQFEEERKDKGTGRNYATVTFMENGRLKKRYKVPFGKR